MILFIYFPHSECAEICLQLEDYEQAMSELLDLGKVLLSSNEIEDAIRVFERAHAIGCDHRDDLLKSRRPLDSDAALAKLMLEKGKQREAVQLMGTAWAETERTSVTDIEK